MERLLLFVFQNRAFFTFLALEIFCAWLVVQNNQYQGTKFFNSSNGLVAAMNNFSQGVRDYFQLSEVNRMLAEENAALKKQLGRPQRAIAYPLDSLTIRDSVMVKQYDFISAKVVNNHVDFFKNFITIDKGQDAGLEPGMGVISPLGVVGKVKTVSKHYSVVTSILHIDWMVSALLKRTGDFGTVQWQGTDPDHIALKYIPPHVKPVVGDSVVTSGYNAIYPEGVMIGIIEDVKLRNGSLFYDINVKLSQDFRKLSFVTLVKNHLQAEQDSVEQVIQKLER
ncbi:rod shape-determining protein MreC [Chryseolinea lacunae]|uniref:Cell shape-determining protein MreC n=1 Tax=Chryseolinea lacunae TaxID=2801331 RepID=A0ABS1KQK9_9BACT|nr:rod shape-determining protein MreC [Chryseolinea lacunae]MBL0741527.1 rod shape-determining protein MreC [Chryseolinea lacunae]